MGYKESWDLIYNVLSVPDKARVDEGLRNAESIMKISTDNGKDLLSFRVFLQASQELSELMKYHLGDLYPGEIIMGTMMLCDYFDCSPFAAVNLWKSKRAVPVFLGNMPYGIHSETEELVIHKLLNTHDFSRRFV